MKASLLATTPGIATITAGCAPDSRYQTTIHTLRRPLQTAGEPGVLLREIVRCATLAANGHNTQPWTFALSQDRIVIHADLSRRTPAVDPDDHHLWVSLGCAAENLALAATAIGKHADIELGPQDARVTLENRTPEYSPLVDAIFTRQSTRTDYDGRPLAGDVLQSLERSADGTGVRVMLLTERAKTEGVLDHVTRANSAQMRDAAFMRELEHWLRFDEVQALRTGDGLFTRASGNPTLPPWLGVPLFNVFFREKSENDRYAKQIRSSAGIAVFVGPRADPAGWFAVGRAYQHFALTATALGVRTSFVNQPVEVPHVRSQFAAWLGLGSQRPDLVVRFGRGPQLPYSLRRPLADVLV